MELREVLERKILSGLGEGEDVIDVRGDAFLNSNMIARARPVRNVLSELNMENSVEQPNLFS